MRPLLLFTLVIALGTAAHAQGRFVVEADEHDFGTVLEGEQARHTFAVQNAGDDALRITAVHPACGCTTPTWTREPIPPGGAGEIVVAFNSKFRVGDFRKSIAVTTDGEPAHTTLWIAGTVVEPQVAGEAQGQLTFETATVDVGTVPTGEEVRVAIPVQNAGPLPVRFLGVRLGAEEGGGTEDVVQVALPEAILFEGDVAEVVVVVRAEALAPGTAFDQTVTLVTSDEAEPMKRLRVMGQAAEVAP